MALIREQQKETNGHCLAPGPSSLTGLSPWPTFQVLASRPIALEGLGVRPRDQCVLFKKIIIIKIKFKK